MVAGAILDVRDCAQWYMSSYRTPRRADVAQRWSRDESDLRLRFAASLVQQQGRAQAHGGEALSAGGPLALTQAVDLAKLAAWFDRANRTRDLLRGPIRPELAMLELLAAWTTAVAPNRNVQQGS